MPTTAPSESEVKGYLHTLSNWRRWGASDDHVVCLVAMGLWLIDNANLEDLARACAERGRWEFLLAVAPLRLKNVTGSPVNPIALF